MRNEAVVQSIIKKLCESYTNTSNLDYIGVRYVFKTKYSEEEKLNVIREMREKGFDLQKAQGKHLYFEKFF